VRRVLDQARTLEPAAQAFQSLGVLGLAAGLALAAALPELPYACGLGTLSLLEGDVVAAPLAPAGGEIEVRRPGLDEAALAPYEISGTPVGAQWRRRVADAQALMAAPPVIGVIR
jgi:O-succinylbenzoate synthase